MAEEYIIGSNAQFNENVDILGKLNLFDDTDLKNIKISGTADISGHLSASSLDIKGNTGIGTNSPVERLHIHKDSATGPFVYITNSSTGVTASDGIQICLLYTSPSPRDDELSRMPSSA